MATIVMVLMLVTSGLGEKQNNSIFKAKMCIYQAKSFNIGDLVTGDPCDKVLHTQYGVMCELMHCTLALCQSEQGLLL